jgi:hypothetical protein
MFSEISPANSFIVGFVLFMHTREFLQMFVFLV